MKHPIGMQVLKSMRENSLIVMNNSSEFYTQTDDMSVAALIERESGITELRQTLETVNTWLGPEGDQIANSTMIRDMVQKTLAKFNGE